MNPPPFQNQSSFTFLPPNPNIFHPSPTAAVAPPPRPPDLPTTLSSLKDLIKLSETTLSSLSTLLPGGGGGGGGRDLSTSLSTLLPGGGGGGGGRDLSTCLYNTHHRIPPDSLFRHSLRCPSSPAIVDTSILHSLRYPDTLQCKQNPFVQTLPDSELCFSLDDCGGDLASNFFYHDCPGIVSNLDQHGTNRMLTLPRVLSAECANFTGRTDTRVLSGDSGTCFRILPSELWFFRNEIEAWTNYPTSYSYSALRVLLSLQISQGFEFRRWLIVNSPRYGIVIDAPMSNHIHLLFRLCLKAITREAAEKEFNLNVMNFSCPVLGQALTWLGTHLAVLYGETNGRIFVIEMLKLTLINSSSSNMIFLKEVDEKVAEPLSSSRKEKENNVIFVSQIAAAVAALHERSLLEGKINAIRSSRQLPTFQRVAEHSYISKKADEERLKRSNYRPIIEHDGLLWQRAHNQESNKLKSREELLAEERDYKRRRMSYRGKKMKRSTTQVMRDIIEEFMEEIKQASGLPKGSEESSQVYASKHVSPLPDSSTDKEHAIVSRNNSSTRCKRSEEGSRSDEKRDSHRHDNEHQDNDIADGYYSKRSSNQDRGKVSRKYRSEKSESHTREHSSHRRDRVEEDIVEYRDRGSARDRDRDTDRKRRNRERNRVQDSTPKLEFEDRYNPS